MGHLVAQYMNDNVMFQWQRMAKDLVYIDDKASFITLLRPCYFMFMLGTS